jgi:hypothetical protein
MARQRVLKPSFNDDDDIAALSFPARLFYAVLWGFLDKQALIEENALALRSKLYPREDFPISQVEGWLDELARPGPSGRPRLIRILWRGKKLLYCPTLIRHSRIFQDEPVYFRVPEGVLREAREKHGIYIDREGHPADPPLPPPAQPNASGAASQGGSERPTTPGVAPTEVPRGSHVGPTEQPPNSHDSSSASAPVSVKVSVPVSAPSSVGSARVDNSGGRGDKSGASRECAGGGQASGKGLTRADPLSGFPPEERARILDANQRLQAKRDRGG